MIEATLVDLRQSSSFFKTTEVVHIINGRKKEAIGYFVPVSLKKEFEIFLTKLEKERKKKLLQRVVQASNKDIIDDGAVDDGIS